MESDEGCWSDHPRPGPGLGPQAPHQGPAGLPGGNTHSAHGQGIHLDGLDVPEPVPGAQGEVKKIAQNLFIRSSA